MSNQTTPISRITPALASFLGVDDPEQRISWMDVYQKFMKAYRRMGHPAPGSKKFVLNHELCELLGVSVSEEVRLLTLHTYLRPHMIDLLPVKPKPVLRFDYEEDEDKDEDKDEDEDEEEEEDEEDPEKERLSAEPFNALDVPISRLSAEMCSFLNVEDPELLFSRTGVNKLFFSRCGELNLIGRGGKIAYNRDVYSLLGISEEQPLSIFTIQKLLVPHFIDLR